MKYMLDTNAIILAMRHPEGKIAQKLKRHLGRDVCISAITYGELEYGIQKSAAPERNRTALTQILLGIRVLDFDSKAAQHFGEIFAELERQGNRIGDGDMLIAGHARSEGLIVVTNNMREFSCVSGLICEDWK